jgi:hypothetical protein
VHSKRITTQSYLPGTQGIHPRKGAGGGGILLPESGATTEREDTVAIHLRRLILIGRLRFTQMHDFRFLGILYLQRSEDTVANYCNSDRFGRTQLQVTVATVPNSECRSKAGIPRTSGLSKSPER